MKWHGAAIGMAAREPLPGRQSRGGAPRTLEGFEEDVRGRLSLLVAPAVAWVGCGRNPASQPVQRALLTPKGTPGSSYRCDTST